MGGGSGIGAVDGAVGAPTRGLAMDLGPKLRITCRSPGMVRSEASGRSDPRAREAMQESTGALQPVDRVLYPTSERPYSLS